ncbi:TonB-dependent siderophore receptor [Pigmentiphaga aceris]|uniref:TonB-dependent siderophore receptor n=1 Tax=Pigmentiphaga aceris TaxID=1940612 RepID=A0A5C0B111_9BURK|nr:TonB-dependent receptor [Pigmentiphaga aceris]QEI07564.1 TonB-dependent siderophore receptor [Pigmentiphaga aceris]
METTTPRANARAQTTATFIGMSALAIAIAVGFGTLPAPALAQSTAVVQVNIPAQPLSKALLQLGEQTSLQIFFSQETVEGYTAPALSGSFPPDEAMRRLLAGTGIQFRRTGNNFSLSRSAPAPGEATQLKSVTVVASPDSVSENTGTYGYANNVLSAGKGSQHIRDVPQSITVMTRQRIEDQGLQTLAEVFKNTTGITTTQRDNEPIGRIYARGFEIQNMQVDGASVGPFSPQYFNPNLAMFDHVEVLRGADGLFAGNGTPGGSVNLVRKRPLAEKQFLFTGSAGRWDRYQTDFDVTGALADDGSVRGRAVYSHEDRKGFVDNDWGRSNFLYGIVEADLGSRTMLSLGGTYDQGRKYARSAGLPRGLDGSDLGLSRSWSADRLGWSNKEHEAKDVFAELQHTFANDWKVKMSAGYGERMQDNIQAGHLITTGIDPLTRSVIVAANGQSGLNVHPLTGFDSTYKNLDVNLQGNFAALGEKHSFLLGADWGKFDTLEYTRRYRQGVAAGGNWTGSIDALGSAPVVYPYPTMGTTRPMTSWLSSVTQYGMYGRMNWSLTDRAKIIGGARYAYYKSDSTTLGYVESGALTSSSAAVFEDKGIFTPYVGTTYDLDERWTAYGSMTEIYQSQANRRSGPLATGGPLDPITGRNYEIGLKGELNDGRLQPAVSVYRIERSKVAVLDPRYPAATLEDGNTCCYSASGEQVSQGVDLELTGEVARGWQIAAGYTYNQNKDKATDAIYHAVTPRHMLRLWANHRFADYSAWSVGLGVNLQSKSYVSGTAFSFNPASGRFDGASRRFNFTQGGYAVWNAAVHYDIDPKWRASLNLNNLFDKRYYANLGTLGGQNIYGEPMSWMLTLKGRF